MLMAHGISSVYISQLNEKLNKKEKASCMDDQIVRLTTMFGWSHWIQAKVPACETLGVE